MNKDHQAINCLIVDDEPLALSLLSDYIEKTPGLVLLQATSDPIEGLSIATTGEADLIFLDMQMPELTGLQFLKVLQQRTLVIITTAYSDYALDGYNYYVVDYLLKPITFERFVMAVEKAKGRKQAQYTAVSSSANIIEGRKDYLFVKTDYRIVKVDFADILYLEGARDYVLIHTQQGQLLTPESMKSLEAKLPQSRFLRIHKSYLIALDKIEFVERSRVSVSGQLLPVSDSFKELLSKHISK